METLGETHSNSNWEAEKGKIEAKVHLQYRAELSLKEENKYQETTTNWSVLSVILIAVFLLSIKDY